MTDHEAKPARHFHEVTKHSPESIRQSRHFLDWANQPLPFKLYRGVEEVPLPPVEDRGERSALEDRSERSALDAVGSEPERTGAALDISGLARLLFYTAGITKRLRRGGGEMLFRAAACTGALYHIEIYLAAGDVEGLEAGLYHYGPSAHRLSVLRRGDWRSALSDATGGEPHVASAAAVFVLTSTFWRNSWKYQTRAYRHAFWDSGTMLANLFAEAGVLALDARLIMGFADPAVNALIDVEPSKEAAVALVAVGTSRDPAPPAPSPPEPLGFATEPLSSSEVDYPLIRETHEASSLPSGAEARRWRGLAPVQNGDDDGGESLPPLEAESGTTDSIEAVIRRRGSSRRFARRPIDRAALATILGCAIRSVPRDIAPPDRPLCDAYVIVNAVDGLASGAYVYHPSSQSLELLREGELRSVARFLDLEQDLAGDAAVNVYLLVDLDPVLECWGDRGYRVAQIEGGILGGRLYLAAYALRLGASGLTFYDDAVTDFFSPHAEGKSVMFLTTIGVPEKRRVLFER